jgi:CubicO group peptidase (beta-lactamase class C family)
MYQLPRQPLCPCDGRPGRGDERRAELMSGPEEGLAAALDQLHGVDIDEAAGRAHVMWPDHLQGAASDRGREDLPVRRFPWPPGPVLYRFDATGFIRALVEQLAGNVAGYSIRLTENGSTIALIDQNWAKEPQDGSEWWTPGTRMHVASLSKIMTAIAMTRLLEQTGISPSAPIIGYLPGYWIKGPDVSQITFAELMTHTSGLAFGATNSRSDFQWMKSQIAAGTTHIGEYSYQNMNFGLCRILLATINGNIGVDWLINDLFLDAFWDLITIRAYASYVAGQVFAPANVTGPDFTHDAADALAYNFPVTGNGWNSGDLTSMAGGAGWHMSVDELLRVMAAFRRGDTIVSTAQAQTMLDDGFGIDWSASTPLGRYYAKNGFWYNGSGQREQGVAFFLPQNMELVVLVNSPVGEGPAGQFLYTVVSDAYTGHIEELANAPVNAASADLRPAADAIEG